MPLRHSLLLVCTSLFLASTSAFADYIYWTDSTSGKIQRARLDGSDVQDLVENDSSGPVGIVIDLDTCSIFWTEPADDQLRRANIDGTRDTLHYVTDISPIGVALSHSESWLFWSNLLGHSIQRAPAYEFEEPQTIVEFASGTPLGVATDDDNRMLYWTVGSDDVIQRGDFDGNNVETLRQTNGIPVAICLDTVNNYMYWTEQTPGSIWRANMDGTEARPLITTNVERPGGIALDYERDHLYWCDDSLDGIFWVDPEEPDDITRVPINGISPNGIALDLESESPVCISLEGQCPGAARLSVFGASANMKVAIVAGSRNESYVVPGLVCPGITIQVHPPFFEGFPLIRLSDDLGHAVLHGYLPQAVCGKLFVQGVDLDTCNVSNLVAR